MGHTALVASANLQPQEVVLFDNTATAGDANQAGTDSSSARENGDNVSIPTTTTTSGTTVYTNSGISALQTELSQTQANKAAIQQVLNDMLENQNSFIENLQELDAQILEYQDKIDQLQVQQEIAQNTVDYLSVELASAQDAESEQYERLKAHIQDEYENGNFSYLDILFGQTKHLNYIPMEERMEYIQQVDSYDQRALQELTDARQTVADKEALYLSMCDDIDLLEDIYTTEQETLNDLSTAKEAQINQYQIEIDETQSDLDTLDELENQQSAQIAEIEAKYQAAIAASTLTYNGDTFLWPMPTSTTITSTFGYRDKPSVEGATSYHGGIDIACSEGSEVLAAADGTVIYASYLGTAGNAVVISHGSGVSTCYYHLSAYNCSVGDSVSRGQVVAYSGNTGASTGPHLHFSVRLNGSYVDPMPYLGY